MSLDTTATPLGNTLTLQEADLVCDELGSGRIHSEPSGDRRLDKGTVVFIERMPPCRQTVGENHTSVRRLGGNPRATYRFLMKEGIECRPHSALSTGRGPKCQFAPSGSYGAGRTQQEREILKRCDARRGPDCPIAGNLRENRGEITL
jgi:hypothetical protein